MSLFSQPSAKLVESINWFIKLTSEQQEIIRKTHTDNLLAGNFEDVQHLVTLITEINTALLTKSKEDVITKLKELGIDPSNASLLVNKILAETPHYKIDLKTMKDASDELFEKAVNTVFVDYYVHNSMDSEIKESFGEDFKVVQAVYRLIRGSVVFLFLRGESSDDSIEKLLQEQYEISTARTKIIIKHLKENADKIRTKFLFANTQDTYLMMQKLIKNQDLLIQEVRELTSFLKQIYAQYSRGNQPGVV